MDWIDKPGEVQIINHYEETRNSPPRLQLFEDKFRAYHIDAGVMWIAAADDGAVIGYPLGRVNQIYLGESKDGEALADASPRRRSGPERTYR